MCRCRHKIITFHFGKAGDHVFLADINDLAALNKVYATFFVEPYPARATIQVARLPRDVRIEIEAIAAY